MLIWSENDIKLIFRNLIKKEPPKGSSVIFL